MTLQVTTLLKYFQFATGLPKTRSGKIMRRILRKIAADKPDELGDISTLADPSVVKSIVKNHEKLIESHRAKIQAEDEKRKQVLGK